jgi:hypothetical protein
MSERKPIGLSVPYRKMNSEEARTLLEQYIKLVKDLTKRVEQLEKHHAKEK